ncbi:MAG: polyprenyl synthetase family protein [Desulfovibrio sp.]|jgi:geranylgeranyl diphosphate synthase type II|nr:polyprenyl synthetase family protein [Desulfovibrio sp.]
MTEDAAIKQALAERAARVEAWLAGRLAGESAPEGLRRAMEYSLLAGGKRIRPVLCLVSAELFGLERDRAMPFACALECIHTYSLIHDDLPAMDDDDLRRGLPSCHKAFDEATAILAGDGLLTGAFGLMTRCDLPPDRLLRTVALAAEAAGSAGMVGGQYLDIRFTGQKNVSLEEVAAMQAMKTGAMLRLACEAGAVLAGADEAGVSAMRVYGQAVGAAFQITDDILDETGSEAELGKPVGSDRDLRKNTYPAVLGLAASREAALRHVDDAVRIVRTIRDMLPVPAAEAALLEGLAAYIIKRVR